VRTQRLVAIITYGGLGLVLVASTVFIGMCSALRGHWDYGAIGGVAGPLLVDYAVDHGLACKQLRLDPFAKEVYRQGAFIRHVVPELSWESEALSTPMSSKRVVRPVPLWSRVRQDWISRPLSDEVGAVYWREEAYGWPWPCLSLARVLYHQASEFEIVDGIPLSSRPDRSWDGPDGPKRVLAIPTKPYWPGLLGSWLVWTAALVALRLNYVVPRRMLRRRRGRCPRCGYDLQGDFDAGCPECGWNRSGSSG
jgi:hypothetical protein